MTTSATKAASISGGPRSSGLLDRDGLDDVGDLLEGVGGLLELVGHLLEPQHLQGLELAAVEDRKSTRLNSSHANISYAVFCLKKKKKNISTSVDIPMSTL